MGGAVSCGTWQVRCSKHLATDHKMTLHCDQGAVGTRRVLQALLTLTVTLILTLR